MALKEFRISFRWWDDWAGGGHTIQTDPTNRGWRCALLTKGSDVAVLGRRGVPGCFTVQKLSGVLDVAVYDELCPEDLVKRIPPADAYKQVPAIPGWALGLIQEMEKA